MRNLRSLTTIRIAALCFLAALCIAAAHAQTVTTLHAFAAKDGANPQNIFQGRDGNFYGVTAASGLHGGGTIFKITPTGTLRTLYNFCSQINGFNICLDGQSPQTLMQASNGNLYGTTVYGGSGTADDCLDNAGCGTVFELSSSGHFTTLYNFCSLASCADGATPRGVLTQGTNGNLYGTTEFGGVGNGNTCDGVFCGTVFEIAPTGGQLTILYTFCAQLPCSDGTLPLGGLTLGTDGYFYGTTANGGATGSYGTIFRMTPSGKLSTMYRFCLHGSCSNGANPQAAPLIGTDGNFYGTTTSGFGTVFQLTPTGQFTTLYTFCSKPNCGDGSVPIAPLVQGNDGLIYGTTLFGADGGGSIFNTTTSGALNTVAFVCSVQYCSDAGEPTLTQSTSGLFYGAAQGGDISYGGIFTLDTGLGPFVQASPNFGKPGGPTYILGNNLTGSTGVSFNGVPATTFTVTGTYIKATVPSGATTGPITVTTASGTLSTVGAFQVLP